MTFGAPLWLVLLGLLVPLWLVARRSRAPVGGAQRTWTLVLQSVALVSLVLALATPLRIGTPSHVTRIAVVAGGDATALAGWAKEIRAWRERQPWSDAFYVVRAGERPTIGQRGDGAIPPAAGAPDLAAALRQAHTLVPEGGSGEIVVYGDGQHDGGSLARLAPLLHGVPLRFERRRRVTPGPILVDVAAPARIDVGEPFEVVIRAESGSAAAAEIEVLQGDRVAGTRAVTLRAGSSRHAVAVTPTGDGILRFDVTLRTGGASDPRRQRERFALLAEGRPQVLHLGSASQRAALAETLAPHGIEVSTDVASLANADVVVVDDLPASAWQSDTQAQVREAVLHGGAGLLLAGGHGNLGPGGYAQSPLADLLPVEMPQREERRDPSTSLVIIIDTSGSMSGSRVELAKEVARLAVRRLMPHDKVGIVEFYGSKRWAAPLQPASNTIEIVRALNRLQAGGGTIIYSALEEAYYALLNVKTRFKHILVLTDGAVESGPFESLARRMAEGGQNLSTVLIGPQGNSPFLMSLAQWGRGRFYACPSRFQLPELRFKEPQSSLLPAVQERTTGIERAGLHEATAAFGATELPPAGGIVEASRRVAASVLLRAEGDRPLLASWDQGRGRVAVWATELLGPLAGELRSDAAYGAFLADLLRGLSGGRASGVPQLRLTPEGSQLRVELLSDLPSFPVPTLHVGESSGIAMVPDGAGRHAALLAWPATDGPLVLAVRTGVGEIHGAAIRPLPSDERAGDASDVLARLVATSGSHPAGTMPLSLTRPLALVALLAFLLSLLIRRLPVIGRAAAMLGLLLGLATPTAAQDPIAERIRAELAEKGHLADLAQEWQRAAPANRIALARAEGDLAGAIALMEGDAWATDRALLLEATGRIDEALTAIDGRIAATTGLERAGWQLRRAELLLAKGEVVPAAAGMRAAAADVDHPDFRQRVGLLAGSYGLYEVALALHDATGTDDDKEAQIVHLRRALWRERLGDVDAARQEYEAAYSRARLQRDRRFVLSRITALMRRAGRLPELARDWLAKPAPAQVELEALLGVLRELGRGREALELLARHGELSETMPGESLAIAVEAGDIDTAVRFAREQLLAHPQAARLRTSLALLLSDLRRNEEASAVLVEGLPHAGNRKDLLLLAQTASELNLDHAFVALRDALAARDTPRDRVDALFLDVQRQQARKQKREAVRLLLAARTEFTAPEHRLRIAEAIESLGERAAAITLLRAIWEETRAEDLGLRLAWLLGESSVPAEREESFRIFKHIWLNAGSKARRVQAEERVLDLAARDGTLADLAIELEEELEKPTTEQRDAKREALVKIYTRARDAFSAAEILEAAMRREPARAIDLRVDLSRMYLQNEEFIAYERCLQELITLDPAHEIDYRQELAMSALERGRPYRAREVIREMLGTPGKASEIAYEFAAGIYTLAGRARDAIRVYRRSLARYPDRIETLLLLANAMRNHEQTGLAIGMFCDILLQDPKDDLFIVAVDGLLNLSADESTLRFAERAVRRRLAATGEHVYMHRVLQDVLEQLREDATRRRSMEDMLAVAGEQRPTFVRELMQEAESRRDWPSYVAYGYDLLALGEEMPPAVFVDLGEAMVRAKDLHGAERAFERARLATDFAAVERRVAEVYESTGFYRDAERVRRRVLRRDPENPRAILDVARLVERRGSDQEALSLYLDAATRLIEGEGVERLAVETRPRRTMGGNRNVTPDVTAEEAIQGALRCASGSGDIAGLAEPLRRRIAEAKAPAERWPLVRGLARILGAFATGDGDELRHLEDGILADATTEPAIIEAILDQRLGDGNVAGARTALARLDPAKSRSEGFTLDLLASDVEAAVGRLAGASADELSAAGQTLAILGHRQAATDVLARLEQTSGGRATSQRRLRRLLGLPVDEESSADERLQRALALPTSDDRRSWILLSALQSHPNLPVAERTSYLRTLLPDFERGRDDNQIFQLLSYAKDYLTAGELLPLFERGLAQARHTYNVVRYIPLLGALPDEEQKRLVRDTWKRFGAEEQRTMAIQALGGYSNQEPPPPPLQRHLVAVLDVRKLAPTDQHYLGQICTSIDLDPEAARSLFQELNTWHEADSRTWALGCRIAAGEEQQERARRGLALLRTKRELDSIDYTVIRTLVGILDDGGRQRLLAELGDRTPIDLVLRAELSESDAEAQVSLLRRAFEAQPDDSTLYRRLIELLTLQDRLKEMAEVHGRYLASLPQIYPHYAGQLAEIQLRLGEPGKALAALDLADDPHGSNLGLRLAVIAALPEPERRASEARAWLQRHQAQANRSSYTRIGVTRGNRWSPREALAPLEMAKLAPPDWQSAMQADAWDLLGFFPEGARIASIQLRTLDAGQQDQVPGLYRGWLRAAHLSGEDAQILAAARARLAKAPMDAESLRILFAAAEVGLAVSDDELERAIRSHALTRRYDVAFLARALLLAESRGQESLVEHLLSVVLAERGYLSNWALRPYLASVLAIAKRRQPDLLVRLMPGKESANPELDCDLLVALDGVADPQAVVAGYAGVPDRSGRRSHRQEAVLLPWIGWQLRAGNVDVAIAALDIDSPSLAQGDQFPPQALAAAIPELSVWKSRDDVAKVRDALLAGLASGTPGQRALQARLAILLAIRLEAAGDTTAAAELAREIRRRGRSVAGLATWL